MIGGNMYSISSSSNNSLDIMDTIEDNDIFNSKFIYLMSSVSGSDYLVTKYLGRLDLILKDMLDDYLNYGVNFIHNRSFDNMFYCKNQTIKLLNSNDIASIRSM